MLNVVYVLHLALKLLVIVQCYGCAKWAWNWNFVFTFFSGSV